MTWYVLLFDSASIIASWGSELAQVPLLVVRGNQLIGRAVTVMPQKPKSLVTTGLAC